MKNISISIYIEGTILKKDDLVWYPRVVNPYSISLLNLDECSSYL